MNIKTSCTEYPYNVINLLITSSGEADGVCSYKTINTINLCTAHVLKSFSLSHN